MEVIKGRRSIRKYKSNPVEDWKLKEIFEAARWAPSWANTQCWEFIVVKDSEKKKKLSETLVKGNPAKNAVATAPIVLVACAKKGVSGYGYDGKFLTEKGEWTMFDVALAIQNLTLAAYNLGLGTVQVAAFDTKKVAEILKIPEDVEVFELIPLGYPEKIPKPPPRKNIEEFVYYEEYGRKS